MRISAKEYENWLCLLAIPNKETREKYSILLNKLFETTYFNTLELDENRIIDAVNLRGLYAEVKEKYWDPDNYQNELEDKPCSVLEVMVALARRVEDQIMTDLDISNHAGFWFMSMIKNLGLEELTDDSWYESKFSAVMTIFLNRLYDPNGKGGNLFIVEKPREDMRTTDIWYQCMWWLDEFIKKGNQEYEFYNRPN